MGEREPILTKDHYVKGIFNFMTYVSLLCGGEPCVLSAEAAKNSTYGGNLIFRPTSLIPGTRGKEIIYTPYRSGDGQLVFSCREDSDGGYHIRIDDTTGDGPRRVFIAATNPTDVTEEVRQSARKRHTLLGTEGATDSFGGVTPIENFSDPNVEVFLMEAISGATEAIEYCVSHRLLVNPMIV